MTEEELKQSLEEVYSQVDEIGVAVYVLLKGDGELEPKKLDIEGDSLDDLKNLFIGSLRENVTEKEDLTVLNLSSSDERTNAIYLYDLEVPSELMSMDTIIQSDDIPLFDFSECDLSRIKSLLIEIGNNTHQIVLYKSMAPVNIFGRSSFFMKKDNQRFKRIDDEFVRISAGFQLMKISGELFVVDLGAIEKAFGFHDVIIREAALGIEAIDTMEIIENIDTLSELVTDVKYARKFTKIAKSSPVIRANIDNSRIIQFCKTFPQLQGRIRFNDAEDKIHLDTKVSKDLFIQLLMDNFLTSELTNFHYKSVAKDEADEPNGEEAVASE
ncbi:anti-phage protein KwaB [uncultured Paraglaciecola sp.]|mgnify:CR=1 FL=1|uniref:anti-phage protein KwaB n=1 Tax=uncultured Paraglaciecola sp. TaxID=1765024 RepID=UPI0026058AE7|nr:anti-phage protein KwaB [uncultured Paraglaciecola sp.]